MSNYEDEKEPSQKQSKIIPVTAIRTKRREEELKERKPADSAYEKRLAEHDRSKRQAAVASAVVLIIAIVAIFLWRYSIPYVSATEVWSKEQPAAHTFTGVSFADGFLKYNNDGMSYYDKKGEMRWTKTYEMNHPKPYISGNFVVMADIGARSIVICNADGYQGTSVSPLPISTLSVSKAGVVAVVVEDDMGNHILFYDKAGSKLEIDIRTLMSKSGYPLDVAFSPDGKMLMVSYVYLDQAMINNKVVFYNFHDSAAGNEKMVGAFQQYQDTLFGRVHFLDDKNAVALGDGKLVFYSTKNRLSPTQTTEVDFTQTMVKVFCEESKVIVITRDDQSGLYNIFVQNANGSRQLSFSCSYLPTGVGVQDDMVYFYNENTLTVYNKVLGKYQKRFEGHFSKTLRTLVPMKGDNEFMILSDTEIMKIRLER